MIWLALLGLISLTFILVGWNLAVRRMRRHSQEEETRSARALAEMKKIAEEMNAERRTQKEIKPDGSVH
jgi:hypothetical protein